MGSFIIEESGSGVTPAARLMREIQYLLGVDPEMADTSTLVLRAVTDDVVDVAYFAIEENQRRKGRASLLLGNLTAAADRCGVTLSIRPVPTEMDVDCNGEMVAGEKSQKRHLRLLEGILEARGFGRQGDGTMIRGHVPREDPYPNGPAISLPGVIARVFEISGIDVHEWLARLKPRWGRLNSGRSDLVFEPPAHERMLSDMVQPECFDLSLGGMTVVHRHAGADGRAMGCINGGRFALTHEIMVTCGFRMSESNGIEDGGAIRISGQTIPEIMASALIGKPASMIVDHPLLRDETIMEILTEDDGAPRTTVRLMPRPIEIMPPWSVDFLLADHGGRS